MKRIGTILIVLSLASLAALLFIMVPQSAEIEPACAVPQNLGIFVVIMIQHPE